MGESKDLNKVKQDSDYFRRKVSLKDLNDKRKNPNNYLDNDKNLIKRRRGMNIAIKTHRSRDKKSMEKNYIDSNKKNEYYRHGTRNNSHSPERTYVDYKRNYRHLPNNIRSKSNSIEVGYNNKRTKYSIRTRDGSINEKPSENQLDKVKKDLEYSNRDDLTVLVFNLHLDAQEYDVYDFFTSYAGNVRDIRIIRDHRSGRSKGVCYVEFYNTESVLRALKLNGQKIMDTSVTIQSSQAEKNRAAKLAKLEEIKAETTPLKLRVDGLVNILSRVNVEELRSLFTVFGKVTNVNIMKENKSNKHLGCAYIEFEKAIEGHDAIKALNNFEIAGQNLIVTISNEYSNLKILSNKANIQSDTLNSNNSEFFFTENNSYEEKSKVENDLELNFPSSENISEFEKLENSDDGVLKGVKSRNTLIKKLLDRDRNKIDSSFKETTCLLLSNMFTEKSIEESMSDEETIEEVLDEILRDVEEECEKYGKVVKCYLNKEKKDGNVWVKYEKVEESKKAFQVFQGRYFGGRKVQVKYVCESEFPN